MCKNHFLLDWKLLFQNLKYKFKHQYIGSINNNDKQEHRNGQKLSAVLQLKDELPLTNCTRNKRI